MPHHSGITTSQDIPLLLLANISEAWKVEITKLMLFVDLRTIEISLYCSIEYNGRTG
jgi:hypothetical protein